MIKLSISEKDFLTILELQKNHPHPVIRRRALVLQLKYKNVRHHQIADIVGITENTAREYMIAYEKKGVDSIQEMNFYKPESKLKIFDEIIKEHFLKYPPFTINHACAEVEKLVGLTLKPTQMRHYLKILGMKCRKVNSIPAKADIEKQQKFHDDELQPKLQEAIAGKREVYFVDAAHFVMGAFLGFLWSFTRLFVRTPSGRQRFNVLGALNAMTKKLVTITNDSYITSIQVCELLRKLSASTKKPITLVLDNARYQRCKLVMALAVELNIELLFLPPYSPNLNLIERLWKLVKKECLYSIYHESFPLFRQKIQTFLDTMNATHQAELNSLLTLKFQLFHEDQVKNAL